MGISEASSSCISKTSLGILKPLLSGLKNIMNCRKPRRAQNAHSSGHAVETSDTAVYNDQLVWFGSGGRLNDRPCAGATGRFNNPYILTGWTRSADINAARTTE